MILPDSTHVPLRGGPVLRWGILAPGTIADAWTTTVHRNTDQRVVAVGSRTRERAEAFAAKHSIPRAFGSYEELVADPEVDIVYIAAPHSEHRNLAFLAIAAGKHVLVEKPIGLTAQDALDIAEAAQGAGVFAMEAMWSRFLPQMFVLERLLADGALGDVLTVTADFGFRADYDPASRAFNPALGGGALLDVGIYPIWFAHFVLDTPRTITATGSLAETGVDAQAAVILDYDTPAQSVLTTSLLVDTPWQAVVNGTLARVDFPRQFMGPSGFTVTSRGKVVAEYADPNGFRWRDGLCYQATAVAQYLADGLTEAPPHPFADTVAVLEVIDEARRQLGAK